MYSQEDIYAFVFCWKDKYNKVLEIENQIDHNVQTKVINSSENFTKKTWVNLGDQAFFNKQFFTALDIFLKSDKKIFFHIQGDTFCKDISCVLNKCLYVFNTHQAGIYSPYVTNVYSDHMVLLKQIEYQLYLSNFVDETFWAIDRDIIETFFDKELTKAFQPNKYGWGYDQVMCTLSWMKNKPVFMDFNLKVGHEKSRGYYTDEANKCYRKMRRRLPKELKEVIKSLQRQHILEFINNGRYTYN